jgi:hypothetical protein
VSTKIFAKQMRETIEDVKANGTAAIYCDNIINYLKEVEASPTPDLSQVEIEKFKSDLQQRVEAKKQDHESNLEMFRTVISSGQNAIRSSFLLNGGAAVALLAFLGHLASDAPSKVSSFAPCLLPFGYGVLCIAIVSGLTYLSQWLYASECRLAKKAGFISNILCIAGGLCSYGFFTWGLLSTHELFSAYA